MAIGLANRVSPAGGVLGAAVELAEQLAAFPQTCLRRDRLSTYEQDGLDLPGAIDREWEHGLVSLQEATEGAARFAGGEGRHGSFS